MTLKNTEASKDESKTFLQRNFPSFSVYVLVLWLCLMLMGARWFGTTMGTGIVAILLHQLPYQFRGLEIISTVIFLLNVVLFVVLCVGSIIRYVVWPKLFVETMLNPVQSCFWYDLSSALWTLG